MMHRMAIAAMVVAPLIAGACTDRDGASRLTTEPGDAAPTVSYVSTGRAAVVNPRTHRLESVGSTAPEGIRASIVAGTTTASALLVSSSEPGVASSGGTASFSYVDASAHTHKIALLYRSIGGPPAAMQHYVDGQLVSTSSYAWLKTSTGWVRTRSVLRAVRNGTFVGTYTTITTLATQPINGGPVQPVRLDHPPAVGPIERVLGATGYVLAFALAPQDASAQGFYFYLCRQEWLHYAGAAAVLSAAAATLAAAPELTPLILSAFVGALATTAAYEDLLIDCMIAHETVSTGPVGGAGTGSFGSGGQPDWDCLEGSYAAHCTTPFTL
jgi:hypothetical protein